MRCIHIYRGAPQLGGIKLHKHFSWFHTAKWGVHHIAPRTVLHVIRIVLTMELQPLKTVELHGWVCPPRFTGEKRVNLPDSHGLQTHTHTHTHKHTHTQQTHICTTATLWGYLLCVRCGSHSMYNQALWGLIFHPYNAKRHPQGQILQICV